VPEIIEVEAYRALADRVVGRRIASVDAPDAWYLKGGVDAASLRDAIVGHVVERTRRVGKLLLVDLHGAPTLGLRFGMTGRLVVDGIAGIDELEYGSVRDEPAWERFRLGFDERSSRDGVPAGGGLPVMVDARRLGAVLLDPAEDQLGFDVLSLTKRSSCMSCAVGSRRSRRGSPDQSCAGSATCSPTRCCGALAGSRPARSLDDEEIARLRATIAETLVTLGGRGSHR
jgi:formamidopyrimidine-DNA glycosylase